MNIPSSNIEIERIYAQLFGSDKCAISIASANTNEGVSSIAFSLAQRNLLAGKSTLLVDLNLHHPSLNQLLDITSPKSSSELLPSPHLVSTSNNQSVLTGITAPRCKSSILKLRRPGVLEECIKYWQSHFDNIIIDCSPINRINANNIPAERVASACDGCILVVLASKTSESMLLEATRTLQSNNAILLGCIYNDRDNPPLKDELLREIDRLPKYLNPISNKLRSWVSNNKLLSLCL